MKINGRDVSNENRLTVFGGVNVIESDNLLFSVAEKFKTSVVSAARVNVLPSNVRLDSAVAVASPSDVNTRLLASLSIELIATVTVLNVLSPARNVPPLFVPLDPRRAIGIVPLDNCDAFKLPLKLVADKVCVEKSNVRVESVPEEVIVPLVKLVVTNLCVPEPGSLNEEPVFVRFNPSPTNDVAVTIP